MCCFVYQHWGCISIYWPLSYPFRTLYEHPVYVQFFERRNTGKCYILIRTQDLTINWQALPNILSFHLFIYLYILSGILRDKSTDHKLQDLNFQWICFDKFHKSPKRVYKFWVQLQLKPNAPFLPDFILSLSSFCLFIFLFLFFVIFLFSRVTTL